MTHGWKQVPKAKTSAAAVIQLSKAALLLSEALSHVNAVAFGTSDILEDKYTQTAQKMYDEIRKVERTYHNYLCDKDGE